MPEFTGSEAEVETSAPQRAAFRLPPSVSTSFCHHVGGDGDNEHHFCIYGNPYNTRAFLPLAMALSA